MEVHPECRYCGARVEFFGDTCAQHPHDPETDGIERIARADTAAIAERGW